MGGGYNQLQKYKKTHQICQTLAVSLTTREGAKNAFWCQAFILILEKLYDYLPRRPSKDTASAQNLGVQIDHAIKMDAHNSEAMPINDGST